MRETLPAPRLAGVHPDLDALTSQPFSYPEVGVTRDGELPPGAHHAVRSVVVGSGRAAFGRAVAAVFDWAPQRAAC